MSAKMAANEVWRWANCIGNWAWVRIPFADIFDDIPQADKSL